MIAKAVKGKGFRGALAYDLAPEKGALLDTNMAGETPRVNSPPSSGPSVTCGPASAKPSYTSPSLPRPANSSATSNGATSGSGT